MKIFDCTTFFEEHLMMELRFNILNKYVEKFIVVESRFSHSGKEKKLNFDIWYSKKENLILKVSYNRLGQWEYVIKKYVIDY